MRKSAFNFGGKAAEKFLSPCYELTEGVLNIRNSNYPDSMLSLEKFGGQCTFHLGLHAHRILNFFTYCHEKKGDMMELLACKYPVFTEYSNCSFTVLIGHTESTAIFQ